MNKRSTKFWFVRRCVAVPSVLEPARTFQTWMPEDLAHWWRVASITSVCEYVSMGCYSYNCVVDLTQIGEWRG